MYGNAFDLPVYTAPKATSNCMTCTKKKLALQLIHAGLEECSHIECPNRKKLTAANEYVLGRCDNLES